LPRIIFWRLFMRSVGLYFVYFFVAAFLWVVFLAEPPLPPIEITASTEITESGKKTLDGLLLAHTDGFWYVFNENGGRLLTIPDESVDRARMPPDD
jgi:hypothetical protein